MGDLTKQQRQQKIREFIKQGVVKTVDEIIRFLRPVGGEVSPFTIGQDLKDLKLKKVIYPDPDCNGNWVRCYRPESEGHLTLDETIEYIVNNPQEYGLDEVRTQGQVVEIFQKRKYHIYQVLVSKKFGDLGINQINGVYKQQPAPPDPWDKPILTKQGRQQIIRDYVDQNIIESQSQVITFLCEIGNKIATVREDFKDLKLKKVIYPDPDCNGNWVRCYRPESEGHLTLDETIAAIVDNPQHYGLDRRNVSDLDQIIHVFEERGYELKEKVVLEAFDRSGINRIGGIYKQQPAPAVIDVDTLAQKLQGDYSQEFKQGIVEIIRDFPLKTAQQLAQTIYILKDRKITEKKVDAFLKDNTEFIGTDSQGFLYLKEKVEANPLEKAEERDPAYEGVLLRGIKRAERLIRNSIVFSQRTGIYSHNQFIIDLVATGTVDSLAYVKGKLREYYNIDISREMVRHVFKELCIRKPKGGVYQLPRKFNWYKVDINTLAAKPFKTPEKFYEHNKGRYPDYAELGQFFMKEYGIDHYRRDSGFYYQGGPSLGFRKEWVNQNWTHPLQNDPEYDGQLQGAPIRLGLILEGENEHDPKENKEKSKGKKKKGSGGGSVEDTAGLLEGKNSETGKIESLIPKTKTDRGLIFRENIPEIQALQEVDTHQVAITQTPTQRQHAKVAAQTSYNLTDYEHISVRFVHIPPYRMTGTGPQAMNSLVVTNQTQYAQLLTQNHVSSQVAVGGNHTSSSGPYRPFIVVTPQGKIQGNLVAFRYIAKSTQSTNLLATPKGQIPQGKTFSFTYDILGSNQQTPRGQRVAFGDIVKSTQSSNLLATPKGQTPQGNIISFVDDVAAMKGQKPAGKLGEIVHFEDIAAAQRGSSSIKVSSQTFSTYMNVFTLAAQLGLGYMIQDTDPSYVMIPMQYDQNETLPRYVVYEDPLHREQQEYQNFFKWTIAGAAVAKTGQIIVTNPTLSAGAKTVIGIVHRGATSTTVAPVVAEGVVPAAAITVVCGLISLDNLRQMMNSLHDKNYVFKDYLGKDNFLLPELKKHTKQALYPLFEINKQRSGPGDIVLPNKKPKYLGVIPQQQSTVLAEKR